MPTVTSHDAAYTGEPTADIVEKCCGLASSIPGLYEQNLTNIRTTQFWPMCRAESWSRWAVSLSSKRQQYHQHCQASAFARLRVCQCSLFPGNEKHYDQTCVVSVGLAMPKGAQHIHPDNSSANKHGRRSGRPATVGCSAAAEAHRRHTKAHQKRRQKRRPPSAKLRICSARLNQGNG